MGVAVFGHWGPPLLAFPTSHGDEWELQRHGLIDAHRRLHRRRPGEGLLRRVEQPRVVPQQRRAPVPPQLAPADVRRVHPRRSVPVHLLEHCQSPGIPITTMGASLGAYHAANTLFRYPAPGQALLRALRGSTTCARFMDGIYDDNFYFHNPDRLHGQPRRSVVPRAAATLRDPARHRLGAVGEKRLLYAMSGVLARKGIRASPRRLGPAGRPRLAVLERDRSGSICRALVSGSTISRFRGFTESRIDNWSNESTRATEFSSVFYSVHSVNGCRCCSLRSVGTRADAGGKPSKSNSSRYCP